MNSIFLISGNNSIIEEAHFNLWMVGGDNPFIDIGLKLKRDQEITLFMPWLEIRIEDLYRKIKDDDVLNALFNQHLRFENKTENSYKTTFRDEDKFDVMEADFQIVPHQNNKFSKILIKGKYQSENDAYIRLRARGFKEDIFNKKHKITSWGLSPYNETIEAIDFRINEIRTVKKEDLEGMSEFSTPGIKKLHFFLLKSFSEMSSLISPNYDRCRELEGEAWKKYLASNDDNSRAPLFKCYKKEKAILAYHWKKEIKKGEHFSVLTTFSKKKVSWWSIIIYLFIILLLNNISVPIGNQLMCFLEYLQ